MRLARFAQIKTALGSEVGLSFVADSSQSEADRLFTELWRVIFGFERRFSRFLPASEVTLFNRSAGSKFGISDEFKALLVSSQEMSLLTGGLHNPLILPALQKAGYVQSAAPGYERDAVDNYSYRHVTSADALTVGDDWAMIPRDSAIDMGGCGKGFLADLLRDVLVKAGVAGYWLSFGGDIATGGTDEYGRNLSLHIQAANDLGGVLDWAVHCPTTPFAVATSGTFRRQNQIVGAGWHHIIDPVTFEPARTDVKLATVCADNTLLADVLASCAVILGSKLAPAFLKSHGALAMLLQCHDDSGSFDTHFGPSIAKEKLAPTEGGIHA
ncbi:MAG: FAD:protein FMN transferase [Candidatus Saccharibacteria bacterium]